MVLWPVIVISQQYLKLDVPLSIENDWKWSTDKDFANDFNGEMRRNHQYYFQIQHQILITGVSHVYFYV